MPYEEQWEMDMNACRALKDSGPDVAGTFGSESMNNIVAMDSKILWTVSESPSIKRCQVRARRTVRAAALSAEGTSDSPVSSPPPIESARDYYMQRKPDSLDLSGSRASHLTHVMTGTAIADLEIGPGLEGEQTWYGIPLESSVRRTSPKHARFGEMLAADATSYSTASRSLTRSNTIHSYTRPEESMIVQATPRSRAVYKCLEALIYTDEAGYGPERQFSEEVRLNISVWVLRRLFYGFIREEQRQAARRAHDREHNGHYSSSPHRPQAR
ncbi:hypothetical protein L226DRAFT_573350 [Lentinus tigrinus ALCF2SS1-7]|uniref:Uncharacterized protein n=1 Tax=Lentinus tigrinus ALCF2SS1-6 TaxID=1328759 RepID=A0A5C2S9J7_9APHY|nr:hypothetical protein L227DRAFT_613094 [Lentinus tigrinus ALCF2SS1-6]RPD72305.1 hypothetical protein L226DRAFT_573350 [Lentinus tigrinus ALCF2SS1-7]